MEMMALVVLVLALAVAVLGLWLRLRRQRADVEAYAEHIDRALDDLLAERPLDARIAATDDLWGHTNERLLRLSQAQMRRIEALQREQRSLQGLVADISHQTKTPLANIQLYLERLEQGAEDASLVAKLGAQVEKLESRIDHFEDRIGSYVIQITNRNMLENDSAKMSVILHSINDLERISDHAVNLKESAQEMQEKGLQMSFEGNSEIMFLRRAVTDLVNLTVQALRNNDKKLAKEIEPLEEVIDDLSDELKRRHVIRLKEGRCTIEMGFVLTDMTTSLERIADHCSNIGVSILESSEENIGRHAYLNSVKKEDTKEFQERYEHYRELYFFE